MWWVASLIFLGLVFMVLIQRLSNPEGYGGESLKVCSNFPTCLVYAHQGSALILSVIFISGPFRIKAFAVAGITTHPLCCQTYCIFFWLTINVIWLKLMPTRLLHLFPTYIIVLSHFAVVSTSLIPTFFCPRLFVAGSNLPPSLLPCRVPHRVDCWV